MSTVRSKDDFVKSVIIAVDGPAGSGKSTVSKLVATDLGFLYIDTGAMYRAVTLEWLKQDSDLEKILREIKIDFEENGKKILVNGQDVTQAIRTNKVNQNVSYVASHKLVRDKLLELQRKLASFENVVMDGRDIGTVVFPNAALKIFLSASPEVRARRRQQELASQGEVLHLELVITEIKKRDELDSQREIAPMLKAPDAIEINTDNLSIAQVVNEITRLASKMIS